MKIIENNIISTIIGIGKMTRIKIVVVDIPVQILRLIASTWSSTSQDINSALTVGKKFKTAILDFKNFLVEQQDPFIIAYSDNDQDFVFIQCKKA